MICLLKIIFKIVYCDNHSLHFCTLLVKSLFVTSEIIIGRNNKCIDVNKVRKY